MFISNLITALLPLMAEATTETPKEAISSLKNLSIDDFITKIVNGAIDLGLRILIAAVVFYIGRFIIGKLYKIANAIMIRRNIDESLRSFLLSLLNITLLFILLISVIGILGIETSSFVAIFASASVAIGLALSGTLQNFAGGVLILLIKPYKVGDFIEFNGYTGTVKEIQIFHTVINTIDNKCIIIPNGGLSTGTINNYSAESYRLVEWNIGITYGDNIDKARQVILAILKEDSRIIEHILSENENTKIEPSTDEAEQSSKSTNLLGKLRSHKTKISEKAEKWKQNSLQMKNSTIPSNCTPTVVVKDLADSSVVLMIRAWTESSLYWNVFFDINEQIYKQLPANGISFPFPQMDVHLSHIQDPKC